MATDRESYERQKATARRRQAEIALAGRDIGELPEPEKPSRRKKCAVNFRLFCETYFPGTFRLAWSPDHLIVIERTEQAVLRGGLFALAMPRGSGKSSIAETACLWALLNGHREFVCLIGSDEGHAQLMLQSIRVELSTNELLAADYPEVCFPIGALEGIANRCKGQLYQGEPTAIGWTVDQLVLPTIKPEGWGKNKTLKAFVHKDGLSKASGGIVKVAGITGRVRGMKFKRQDGKNVRPSLVVIDDPQTDESAFSPSQCATRERTLSGAILGLAGPGVKISGIMPCTVIAPGDMADRILNRDLHPEWNGHRCKMVYEWPVNEKLWHQYGEIRADSLRAGRRGEEATEFYRENREAMDAGARVAWPERHNEDELSAIQHAWNLRLRDEDAFFAEYQNEPRGLEQEDANQLTPELVTSRINRHARGLCPAGTTRLTAFVDVQGDLLYYLLAAWSDDFTGAVIDYGTYPDQMRPYFTLRDARPTLANATGINGVEGAIFAGLERLANQLLGREWPIDGGGSTRVERCLVDANWGASTDTVYRWVRQSAYAALLLPSHGKAITASAAPMDAWQRQDGERRGLNWCLRVARNRTGRYLVYDVNFWKTFVASRLLQPPGERGALSLFGDRTHAHRLLADHLCAEYRVRTSGRGREVDEWKWRPNRPDNHWLDCLAGCAAAASALGASLAATPAPGQPGGSRGRVSYAEMQRRAREGKR